MINEETLQEIEMNREIAKMIGSVEEQWYPSNKDTRSTGIHLAFPERGKYPDGKRYHCDSLLKFHSDANWQLQAIEWIEENGWYVNINRCEVSVYDFDYKNTANGYSTSCVASTKKLAIFNVLYAFSQHLKILSCKTS